MSSNNFDTAGNSRSNNSTIMGSSAAARVSVDQLHDHLDSLVLAIFNTIRGHTEIKPDGSNIGELQSSNSLIIQEKYKATLNAIDNLIGIDTSQTEQEQILEEQSQKLAALKQHILNLEVKIHQRRRDIDAELNVALSNQALGIGGSSTN